MVMPVLKTCMISNLIYERYGHKDGYTGVFRGALKSGCAPHIWVRRPFYALIRSIPSSSFAVVTKGHPGPIPGGSHVDGYMNPIGDCGTESQKIWVLILPQQAS